MVAPLAASYSTPFLLAAPDVVKIDAGIDSGASVSVSLLSTENLISSRAVCQKSVTSVGLNSFAYLNLVEGIVNSCLSRTLKLSY